MSKGFYTLIAAQFISALADNALLLIAIAILVEWGEASWWIPLLKAMFTLSYVFLAPWMGLMSDRWPKHRVMLIANLIKLGGCIGMILGLNVIVCFSVVGLGAALYSPAKYGWITEVEPPDRLVRANGWIEVSTVSAAIFGITLGGLLISDSFTHLQWVALFKETLQSSHSFLIQLAMIATLYITTLALNFYIPPSLKKYAHLSLELKKALQQFFMDQLRLWNDFEASISLSVTTLFWGIGAVMQLLILSWAQQILGLGMDQGAYLQGCTALGVVVGAWMAAQCISLERASSLLWLGVLLGAVLPLLNYISSIEIAVATTIFVGAICGFFIVPMNALLQHRGVTLLSAGKSIAIQNFNENASVLTMMGIYSLLLYLQLSIDQMIVILGVSIGLCMLLILLRHRLATNSKIFKTKVL
jgi:MFS family permease